jgi:Tfp pilus assembly protein PilO
MLFRDRQQIAICVVAAALIADFILFGCLPVRTRLEAIKKARAAQKLVVTGALAEQKKLPVLKKQLEKLRQTVGDHHVTVPAETDFGVFLQQVAGLMSRHELTEQVVTPGAEIRTEDLNCIPVNLQCKGRLVHMFEFFRQLQNLDRLIRIESVKLSNDSELSGQVSMETQAFVYYRPGVEQS